MRKVVIVGGGAAAFSCAESLRYMCYTGELNVVSDKTEVPFNKEKLRKSIKHAGDKDFQIRPEEWYEDFGINIMFGTKATSFQTRKKNYFIGIDGYNGEMEYDALCLATGSKPDIKTVYRGKGKKNVFFFNEPKNHARLKSILENGAKKVVLMGCNLEALELASTIRMDYPMVEVKVMDCNIVNQLKKVYGDRVSKSLLDYYKNRGIKFVFGKGFASFQESETNLKLVTGLKTKDTKLHEGDAFVMFPNNNKACTDWIERSDVWEDCKADTWGKLFTEPDSSIGNKMLFGAGSCTGFTYQPTSQRMGFFGNYREAINQGRIASYNMLGLGIPYYMTPFVHTKHFGRTLQRVGVLNLFDDVHIEGDIESLDFTAIYSMKGMIQGALISSSQKNKANIIAENMKYGYLSTMEQIKERFQTWDIMERKLKNNDKHRCFNSEIFEIRFEPIPKLILWKERERMGDTYFNIKEDGLNPNVSEIMDE